MHATSFWQKAESPSAFGLLWPASALALVALGRACCRGRSKCATRSSTKVHGSTVGVSRVISTSWWSLLDIALHTSRRSPFMLVPERVASGCVRSPPANTVTEYSPSSAKRQALRRCSAVSEPSRTSTAEVFAGTSMRPSTPSSVGFRPNDRSSPRTKEFALRSRSKSSDSVGAGSRASTKTGTARISASDNVLTRGRTSVGGASRESILRGAADAISSPEKDNDTAAASHSLAIPARVMCISRFSDDGPMPQAQMTRVQALVTLG